MLACYKIQLWDALTRFNHLKTFEAGDFDLPQDWLYHKFTVRDRFGTYHPNGTTCRLPKIVSEDMPQTCGDSMPWNAFNWTSRPPSVVIGDQITISVSPAMFLTLYTHVKHLWITKDEHNKHIFWLYLHHSKRGSQNFEGAERKEADRWCFNLWYEDISRFEEGQDRGSPGVALRGILEARIWIYSVPKRAPTVSHIKRPAVERL